MTTTVSVMRFKVWSCVLCDRFWGIWFIEGPMSSTNTCTLLKEVTIIKWRKKVEYTGQGTSKQSGGSILTMALLSISTNITLSVLNWDGGGNRTTVWKEPILIQNSHSPWTWTVGLTSAGSGTQYIKLSKTVNFISTYHSFSSGKTECDSRKPVRRTQMIPTTCSICVKRANVLGGFVIMRFNGG